MKFHHTGVVVRDLEEAKSTYQIILGAVVTEGPVYDPRQDAHLLMMRDAAGNRLELIQPASEQSPVAGQAKREAGLAHTCYEVQDIIAEVARLREAGALLVTEPEPAVLFRGKRVAFLFLRTRHLIELVEA